MEVKESDVKQVKSVSYSIKCPMCNKVIPGSKRSQVIYNLKTHLEAKHKGGKDEE